MGVGFGTSIMKMSLNHNSQSVNSDDNTNERAYKFKSNKFVVPES